MKLFKNDSQNSTFELTLNVINIAKRCCIKSINTDLIYGLPHQTKRFQKTLEKC